MRADLLRLTRQLAVAGFTLALAAAAVAAVRPTPEDIAALRTVSDVRLSPDGRWLVYAVASSDFDSTATPSEDDADAGWKRQQQLWLVDANGGAPRQVTRSEARARMPRWSPDGSEIGFLRKLKGQTTIHILRRSGGEAEPVATGELEPSAFGWSPDGTQVAFLATPKLSAEAQAEKWRSGGAIAWDAEWQSEQLYVVPRTGGAVRQVTQGTENVVDCDWSPDGSCFAILCSATADPYEASNLLTLRVVSAADGSALATLDPQPRNGEHPRWSPDGRWVAWLTTHESLSLLNVLQVCAADGSARHNAVPDLDRTFATFEWTPDSRALVAVVRERTRGRLQRFPAAGGPPRDLGFEERIPDGELSLSQDGKTIACLSSTHREPGDPTCFGLSTRTLRVVARANPQVQDWDLGSQETFRWAGPEGGELEGLLALPPSSGGTDRPPLVIMPHGGPDDVTQARFSGMTQFFAAHGYAVFRPNYRGGTGYGQAFYAANRGRLGEIEFMDIESGVDALIQAGRVDPNRLFYGGWSWGGYLTAWTLGHTARYRAAVVGAGVNDVVLSYALSDINHGVAAQWEFKGDPWRQTAAFDRANPIRFIARATTPTLVLHGQSDDRVPFQQGVLLYRALRDVGCPVEFYAYPREPHGIGEPAHVAHRLRVWLRWYDEHGGATTVR